MATTMTTLALDPISRLTRDLRQAAKTLTGREARYMVDAYYQIQNYRIASGNQIKALSKSGEPHSVLLWLNQQTRELERQIHRALDVWSMSHPVGEWSRTIPGVGPVTAAGLLAHIDIRRAPTVGRIWRFAGLDPTTRWEKGKKRPWNADLKRICWHLGEAFVKVRDRDKHPYGRLYEYRKALEQARNDAGEYADQAAQILAAKRIGRNTNAYQWYSQGKLPPAHIHARAKRYAVKVFLSHWHHVSYEVEYGEPPPRPYVIEHLGHADYMAPPNWPMIRPRRKGA